MVGKRGPRTLEERRATAANLTGLGFGATTVRLLTLVHNIQSQNSFVVPALGDINMDVTGDGSGAPPAALCFSLLSIFYFVLQI